MSTPVRLLTFAAALVAVFLLALVGARVLLPADLARAGQDRTGHSSSNPEKDSQMDHTTAPIPSAQHSEDSDDEHGHAPAADPVRGSRSPRTATSSRQSPPRDRSDRTAACRSG